MSKGCALRLFSGVGTALHRPSPLRPQQQAPYQAPNLGNNPDQRKQDDGGNRYPDAVSFVSLNIPDKETRQYPKRGNAVADPAVKSDVALFSLEGLLFFLHVFPIHALKMLTVFAHIFDSTATKFLVQQFTGLVRQTARDSQILQFVIAKNGIALSKSVNFVGHEPVLAASVSARGICSRFVSPPPG